MNWSLTTFHAHWMQALVVRMVAVTLIALAVLAVLLWSVPSGGPVAGDDFGHGVPRLAATDGARFAGDDFGHHRVHV